MSKKKILYVRPSGMQIDYERHLKRTFGLTVVPTESFNEAVSLQRGENISFFVICDRIFQYTEQGESGDYGSYSIRAVGRDLAQHFSSRFRMKQKKTQDGDEKIIILFLSNDTDQLNAARRIPDTYSFYKNKKSDDRYQLLKDYLDHFTECYGDEVCQEQVTDTNPTFSETATSTASGQTANIPNIPEARESSRPRANLREQSGTASRPDSEQGFFKKLSRVLNEPIGKKKK